MAHTYASNFIHCIFSTKDRRALIPPARTIELYAYHGAIARSEGFDLIAAGGTADHVHLLITLPATCALARAVQKLKGSSSKWMGEASHGRRGTEPSASVVRSLRSLKGTSGIRSSIIGSGILSRSL
jgi:REP element-mobilizing transposase RayT